MEVGTVRFRKPWSLVQLSVRDCSKGTRLPLSRRVKSGIGVTACEHCERRAPCSLSFPAAFCAAQLSDGGDAFSSAASACWKDSHAVCSGVMRENLFWLCD